MPPAHCACSRRRVLGPGISSTAKSRFSLGRSERQRDAQRDQRPNDARKSQLLDNARGAGRAGWRRGNAGGRGRRLAVRGGDAPEEGGRERADLAHAVHDRGEVLRAVLEEVGLVRLLEAEERIVG